VGAESAYRQALLLRPRDTEIRMGLAKALLSQERFAEGLALVGEILHREPLNRELWSLRVNALLSNGDLEGAMRSIEQARRLDRASPELLATLGDLWLNADRPADALAAYREAFQVESPSLPRMLRAVEGFLMLEDVDRAARMIEQAEAGLSSDDPPERKIDLLRLRARHALLAGKTEQAMSICAEVLRMDPLDGRTLLTLAELQSDGGDIPEAVLNCERAARLDGFEADALLLQARIEVNRGQYARAIPLLESAQAFESRDYVGRYLEQVRRLAQ